MDMNTPEARVFHDLLVAGLHNASLANYTVQLSKGEWEAAVAERLAWAEWHIAEARSAFSDLTGAHYVIDPNFTRTR